MDKIRRLERFKKAMCVVYGPFTDLTQAEAHNWKPPTNPGAGGHRGRYLWTDAFGVINFITLSQETSSPKYLTLAKSLIEIVHDVLGRTRDGSARLPGASSEEPLRGGLRIGKMASSGRDRDGQYHHYLTLWMFALNRMSLASDDPRFNNLAIQLAASIHPKFVLRTTTGGMRMVWKISMDMDQVLVPSEGHLDAATGYVIYKLLQQTAISQGHDQAPLGREIEDYRQLMNRGKALSVSEDTLDLGMGLWMSHIFPEEPWAARLREEGIAMAHRLFEDEYGIMAEDFTRRLAFREFGVCLGISCVEADAGLRSNVVELIKSWEDHEQNEVGEDSDLRPISQVMYSAALISGAFRRDYLGRG